MILDLLNESEVWFEDGKVVVRPEYFTTPMVTAAAFSVCTIVSITLFGGIYPGVALGVGALFSWAARREASRINSDRRKPHKVVPEIIDWEREDSLRFSHTNKRRFEYVGVTDNFRVIVGKRKHVPIQAVAVVEEDGTEKERIRKRYGEVFTVPPLYVKRYLEENKSYQRRTREREKEAVIQSENQTYQEYLDTISQEKKKLNGSSTT